MHSDGAGGMMEGYQGYGYGAGGLETVLWIAIIAAIAWVAYHFAKGSKSESRGTALEILNARYAKSEITRDEYLKMRKDLED